MVRAYSSPLAGSDTCHRGVPGSMPQARTNPSRESRTCSRVAGAIRALVNNHCNSRARARSKPILIGARTKQLIMPARNDNCMLSSKSKRRCDSTLRTRISSRAIALLSKVINSISGSIAVISLASSLPMIQVNRVCGHAACKARSAANAWQVSPMAERRSRHTFCGGGSKRYVIEKWSRNALTRMTKDGGRRIATSEGAMLADPACLGNLLETAGEALFDPDYWRNRGELAAASGGRGAAWFIASGVHQWALRHFRRGGYIARVS